MCIRDRRSEQRLDDVAVGRVNIRHRHDRLALHKQFVLAEHHDHGLARLLLGDRLRNLDRLGVLQHLDIGRCLLYTSL